MTLSPHALEEVHSRPDQLGANGGEHQGLAVGGDRHHCAQDDDAKELLPVQCLKLVCQVFWNQISKLPAFQPLRHFHCFTRRPTARGAVKSQEENKTFTSSLWF